MARWPGPGLVRRLAGHRAGAAAVEFGILALPFLMLLCVVAESGFVTLAQQTLDLAVDRGIRQLRTGSFQVAADGGEPTARFRRLLCSSVVLFPCGNLRVDVARAGNASSQQPAEPFDTKKKTWALGFGQRFDCPQAGDTVTVRAAVAVPRLFRLLDFTGRTMGDGGQMLIATGIFRVEATEQKSC